MRQRPGLLLTLLGLALAIGTVTEAQPRRRTQPYLIEMEGYVGEQRAEPKGTTEFGLSHRGEKTRFHLSRLRVLVGTLSPSSLLTDLEPYRNSLNLRGAQSMVDRLRDAGTAERVTISGYLRRGSRDLMVNEVTVFPGKSPPTVTSSTPDTR